MNLTCPKPAFEFTSQSKYSLSACDAPAHTCLFKPSLDNGLVRALYCSAADKPPFSLVVGIIYLLLIVFNRPVLKPLTNGTKCVKI